MKCRTRITLLFLAFAASLVAAKTVEACVCANTDDTVLGKYEEARFVVIARAASLEKSPEVTTSYSGDEVIKGTEMVVRSTKMVIEKVFKGSLKAGDEMIFGQGEAGSCFEDFDDDDIGAKLLLYLEPKEKTPKIWYAEGCGKSKPLPGFNTGKVGDAADDLSYLEEMGKMRGKTRVSGTLIAYQWSPSDGGADFKRIAGRKVRIIGEEKTYEVETDEDGVYEIYDLPPGRYTVNPETLKGWKIENPSAWGGGGSGTRGDDERFQLTLKAGRHAYFDFFFQVDNRVRGRVLDPSGRPLKNVCVELLPAQGKVSEFFKRVDCTNEDGSFEIDEIPFGSYLIVVNKDDRISPYEPFRRFYYPDVQGREKARVISIIEGENPEAVDIQIPEMKEVVTVEGAFLTSDGKPVMQAGIYFKAEETGELIEGDAFTRTFDDGRFSLKVLKGSKGKLFGKVTLNEDEFKDCPQVIALLRENGGIDWRDEVTDAVEIQTQGNVDQVELRLPFSSCNGAKIVSRIKID